MKKLITEDLRIEGDKLIIIKDGVREREYQMQPHVYLNKDGTRKTDKEIGDFIYNEVAEPLRDSGYIVEKL